MRAINFKDYIIHLVAIVIFGLVSAMYFSPQLSGKKISQGDTVQYLGMSKEIKDYHEKTGIWSQWTNSGFGGMPSYQIHTTQPTNLTTHIRKALSLWIPRPIGLFIFGSMCFYLMALTLGVHPWLGIFGAIAFAFNTNNVVLFEAGHNTKILTIMCSPLVIAGVIRAYRGKLLSGLAVFTLGMSLCLGANHPQMTYYLALLLGIYVLIQFVDSIRKGELPTFAKASGLLLLGFFIAFGTSAAKLLPTYEYSKDTMRGQPILKKQGVARSSSEVDGLEWNYATAWSNGTSDLWSSYIPMAVGGSTGEVIDRNSAFGKEMRSKGLARGEVRVPLYFGGLSSTSGPIYFGAVISFLFMMSLTFLNAKLRWWGIACVLLTLLLSMGKNMEFLYRIFFDYFPFFNKFRTPNSILSVTSVIVPMIGLLALDQFFKKDKDEVKLTQLILPAAILVVGALFVAFAGSSVFNMEGAYDGQLQQAGADISKLIDTRASMMQSSALRSVLLILVAFGVCFAYLKGKLNEKFAMLMIALVGVFDLIQVDRGYVNSDDFITERNFKQNFPLRAADEQILKDTDPHYRVMDVTLSNPWSNAATSYTHKTIGGMHAAKLQRYMDIIDRHLQNSNQQVYNMLNTKYFITQNQQGAAMAQKNPSACGNAWFVDEIKMVASANEEIDALSNFDANRTAIIHNEFAGQVGNFQPQKSGVIELVSYAPNRIEYSSNSTKDQLAVFSEVWYGPDKGWKASIDGKPVDHLRANYILRALKVPSGKHSIVFEFAPSSYRIGSIISLICSLIVVLGLGFMFYQWLKKEE